MDELSRLEQVVGDLLDRSETERIEALRVLELQNPKLARLARRLLPHQSRFGELQTPPEQGRLSRGCDSEDQDPLIGATLGDFTLLRMVGAGGMGRVYEARQGAPERIVAVKVLSQRLMRTSTIRRFVQEGQVLASLEHAGICRVIAAGSAVVRREPVPFIAMEYVDGRPLTLGAASLSVQERLSLMCEVCDAVEHAHRKGVIHRDLKPANILVAPDSQGRLRARVVDFGLARFVDNDPQSLTGEAGAVLGTPDYMSPEQLAAPGGSVNGRSDVFALGVTMFELLSGRRPFARGSGPAAARHEQRALRDVAPGVHKELGLIVAKAMAAEPHLRYASPCEIANDIRAHLEHRPISAHAPTALYRAQKLVRRRLGWAAGVTLCCGAVGLGLAGALSGVRGSSPRDASGAILRSQAYVSAIQGAQLAIRDNDVSLARERLHGAPAELRGWEWRYICALTVPVHDGGEKDAGVRTFDWELMLGMYGPMRQDRDLGRVQRLDPATLELDQGIPGFGNENIWRGTFTPGGRYFVAAGLPHPEPGVYVFDRESGARLNGRVGYQQEDRGFAVSRSGDRVAIGGESGRVRIFSVPDLKPLLEFQDVGPIVNCPFSADGSMIVVTSPPNHITFRSTLDGVVIAKVSTLATQLDWPQFGPESLYGLSYADSSLIELDPRSGQIIRRTIVQGVPHVLAVFPDGSRVVVGCADGTVLVYPTSIPEGCAWAPVLSLHERNSTINSLYVSPDCQRIFVDHSTASDLCWDAGGKE